MQSTVIDRYREWLKRKALVARPETLRTWLRTDADAFDAELVELAGFEMVLEQINEVTK